MKAALVIMAAGMGSRYGGSKQVDGIGPNNEILMEYSVFDAVRAGFTKIVFIIKPEMLALMKELCGDRAARMKTKSGGNVEVCYAFQDFTGVPKFYSIPPERVKPFGTAHAVLCAREFVTEPFVVINADDYYGADAFETIYRELSALPEQGAAAMVGYSLCNTVSEHGTVSRGVCHVTDGKLRKIVETLALKPCADGRIRDVRADGDGPIYAPDTPVSMNFWGFTPWIFGQLEAYFDAFLRGLAPDEIKAECMLPGLVEELIESGSLSVSVLHSDARWFGMTYREDKPMVARELKKLHDALVYPASLH